ncbi:hypothetical protein CDIK_3346 [Cucumispora dikerogammari]|nr:hypothetical protein CDIK_3346 [Cucumispora dikerogammari]
MCYFLKHNLNREEICIILDNARIHKEKHIARIKLSCGYYYKFLSPYYYMLNPIENAFIKIKNSVRAQLTSEDSNNLHELINIAISTITSEDCSRFFRYMLRNFTNCAAETPYSHQ